MAERDPVVVSREVEAEVEVEALLQSMIRDGVSNQTVSSQSQESSAASLRSIVLGEVVVCL